MQFSGLLAEPSNLHLHGGIAAAYVQEVARNRLRKAQRGNEVPDSEPIPDYAKSHMDSGATPIGSTGVHPIIQKEEDNDK